MNYWKVVVIMKESKKKSSPHWRELVRKREITKMWIQKDPVTKVGDFLLYNVKCVHIDRYSYHRYRTVLLLIKNYVVGAEPNTLTYTHQADRKWRAANPTSACYSSLALTSPVDIGFASSFITQYQLVVFIKILLTEITTKMKFSMLAIAATALAAGVEGFSTVAAPRSVMRVSSELPWFHQDSKIA